MVGEIVLFAFLQIDRGEDQNHFHVCLVNVNVRLPPAAISLCIKSRSVAITWRMAGNQQRSHCHWPRNNLAHNPVST